MRCRSEFPKEYDVPPDLLNLLLASGWEDSSWHNDVCPSFFHAKRRVVLWCDAEDSSYRELKGFARFLLDPTDADGHCEVAAIFATDEVADLLSYLPTLTKNFT